MHIQAVPAGMQDVLKEAEQYGNQVLVAHESDDFQVVERWEPVTEVDVQTPLDVYRELAGGILLVDAELEVSSSDC